MLITKEVGEISFHTLRDNLIDIYKAEGKTVKEVIENFVKGKLEILNKPTKEEIVSETSTEYRSGIVRRRGA